MKVKLKKRILSLTMVILMTFGLMPAINLTSVSISALAANNPAFALKAEGTLDEGKLFNGQATLVFNWQLMANRDGLALKNAQSLRMAYDSSILQLMKWDGSAVISDNGIGVSLTSASQAGRIGVYETGLRVYTAKSAVGNTGYLSLSFGDPYETYSCPKGVYVSLAQVRFAFRSGKSAADLKADSIRCLTIRELYAISLSAAILINTDENGVASYEYLRQAYGAALGGDTLNAPEISYPIGTADNGVPLGSGSSNESSITYPPGTVDNGGKDSNSSNGGNDNNGSNGSISNNIGNIGSPGDASPSDSNAALNNSNNSNVGDSKDSTGQSSLSSTGYVNPYKDVQSTAWFFNAIKYVTENDLMNGVGDGNFSPNTTMTRAMFATVLYRLDGRPNVFGPNPFTDVTGGQWYTDAVRWANENGLIMGYDSNRFGPNDNITREQSITIIYRYSEARDADISSQADLSSYTDAQKISNWAQNAMEWAVGVGLISGRSPTTLVPQGEMTRAEVAQMLMNYH